MKKLTILLLTITFCFSCKETQKEDLAQLNGYWEIKKVKPKDGQEKIFKFNETVDFIEFKNDQGVRTKVKPSLQGDFKATNDTESFTVSKENDQWIGFNIIDSSNHKSFEILRIEEFPQQLMAVVKKNDMEVYIPLNNEFISEIDDENETILMDLPEGLLDL